MWILTKSRFNANWKFTKYYWTYILQSNLLLVYKMENQDCRKCVMWLWCLSWLKNPGDPSITDWSCSRLSTQVVFTAAISKNPFRYPCILPFRPVRFSVCSSMGLTLPKKLCRERAFDQGATRRMTPLNTLVDR